MLSDGLKHVAREDHPPEIFAKPERPFSNVLDAARKDDLLQPGVLKAVRADRLQFVVQQGFFQVYAPTEGEAFQRPQTVGCPEVNALQMSAADERTIADGADARWENHRSYPRVFEAVLLQLLQTAVELDRTQALSVRERLFLDDGYSPWKDVRSARSPANDLRHIPIHLRARDYRGIDPGRPEFNAATLCRIRHADHQYVVRARIFAVVSAPLEAGGRLMWEICWLATHGRPISEFPALRHSRWQRTREGTNCCKAQGLGLVC